jgi:hypothetical protein
MLVRISLISFTLLTAAVASADLSFSTFGPGDTYNTGTGWTICTPASVLSFDSHMAQQFTSATTGDVTAISFASFLASGSGDVTLGLYADDGTDHVGAPLGTWNLVAAFNPAGILTTSIAPGIGISSGQKYWVGLVGANDSWLGWNWNSTGATGLIQSNYLTSSGTASDTLSGFRVETQAVPEPATMAALAFGAVGLLRRRKRA